MQTYITNLWCVTIFSIACSITQNIQAQDVTPAVPDTAYVDSLCELSWKLRQSNPDSALGYARLCLQLAEQQKSLRLQIDGLNRLGIIKRNQGDYDSARYFFNRALRVEHLRNNPSGLARSYNYLGSITRRQENYEDAKLNFLKALQLLEQTKGRDSEEWATAAFNIANVYHSLNMPDSMIYYLKDVIAVLRDYSKLYILGLSYSLAAEYQMDIGAYDSTRYLLQQAKRAFIHINDKTNLASAYNKTAALNLMITQPDSALKQAQKAEALLTAMKIQENLNEIYHNMGYAYAQKGNYDSAFTHYQKSLALAGKKRLDLKQASTFQQLGNLYYLQQQYDSAESYYLQALPILETHSKNATLTDRANLYYNLSLATEQNGKPGEALDYRKKSMRLKDSLSKGIRRAQQLEAQLTQVRLSEENLQLTLDKSQTKLELKETEKARYKLAVALLVVALLLTLSIFFYAWLWLRHKRKALMREQAAELVGRDQAQQRIARDIHDGLGGTLSILKRHFSAVAQGIEHLQEAQQKQYQKAADLLNRAAQEARRIAHELDPVTLRNFGLVPALQEIRNALDGAHDLKVILLNFGFKERLPQDVERNVYQIVLELVNNALKHAKARELTMQLVWSKEGLNVTVEDDGIGFDPASEKSKKGLGMTSITQRVSHLGGSFTFDSGKGAGTTFTMDIPL